MSSPTVEEIVRDRYSAAADAADAALCCPVEYDPRYLDAIPDEIIEKDYGCGDPSRFLRPGDTVLDLGSGAGKICYIAAQVVGEAGRVIGIDMNDDMLALARSYQDQVGATLGYHNVRFCKGRIQDLTLDRDRLQSWLAEHPVTDDTSLRQMESWIEQRRREEPLIADASVDVVVSNCVLNLVSDREKRQLFSETYRVLRRGGRIAISDIVADEPVPASLKEDPELWSGCVSGAMEEMKFLKAFEEAGFYGLEIAKRDQRPWRTVDGIEFRSVTVVGYKGKEGACWDHHEALIYKGPFKEVTDDDGHRFRRGQRVAVCRKTFEIFSREPYADYFEGIDPLNPVTDPQHFPCTEGVLLRDSRQTKGEDYAATTEAGDCCEPGQCC